MRMAIAVLAGAALATVAYPTILGGPRGAREAGLSSSTAAAEDSGPQILTTTDGSGCGDTGGEGSLQIGRFLGTFEYDQEKKAYFLQLRGARFPFQANPKDALAVTLESPGNSAKEKNRSLLYGLLGPKVKRWTVLLNPDEREQTTDAAVDLARYLRMISTNRFGGWAYTKGVAAADGASGKSPADPASIKSLDDATSSDPIILIKGPRSGASSTAVKVLGDGQFVVEGKDYQELAKAADYVALTALKMLCGSADCPDAAACATGGKCGCG